ncbi:ABC transporter permease [Brucella gallinifaecis]|uniref:ABC transporter permease n=1 Tax=Brucella gallinifaecis TaxID=215590 RepID=A0A502BL61_9HYPH|nr:ABC transporter permease [Brucella gallinifaecis]TPF74690.1 ABC transporter permease [Brucella gallinifaecis]
MTMIATQKYSPGKLLLALISGLVLGFLILPILVIIPLSFNDSRYLALPFEGFTWRWYQDFISSPTWREALINSIAIALATTVLSTILGTAAAIGLANGKVRGRKLIETLLLAPLIAPAVIVGVGIYFIFSMLGLTQTMFGLILAHTALAAPFVVVTVGAAMTALDQRLLWAAASMGARPLHAFRKITLPIISPGIISGALFAFTASLDEIVITLFLAGPGQRTLPREMFSAARDTITPTLAAAATTMIVFSTVLLVTSLFVKGRAQNNTTRS